jgi:Tfp pilus assembly protein PilX
MRRNVRDESGVTLVMAVLIMSILMLTGSTLIAYASSNNRHAEYSSDDTIALNVAEAGMNYARSILWNASDPTQASAVPSGSLSLSGGTAGYSGTYNSATKVWTLTGTGTYTNPTGSAAITRTVSSDVQVVTGTGASPAWSYNFSDAQSGCLSIANNASFSAPLYVRGNLCVSNNAHFTGSSLNVGGTLTVGNNGSVGSSGTPIPSVNVAGGCAGGSPNPHACVSGAADSVYATGGVITQNATTLTKPTVDLAYWYQNASPGPLNACTTGSMPGGFDSGASGTAVPPNPDRSRAAFDLTPSTAYTCRTSTGELSWTPGSPGTLVINGTIFFDGNISMSNNANAIYQGRATIYASGTVTLSNNAKLCGISGCTASWDTNSNYLVFVVGAPSGTTFTISNNAVYQGAAYVVADYSLANNSANWGPVIANQLSIANNAGSFIPLTSLPAGAPGSSAGTPTLQNVPDSYRATG